MPFYLFGSYTIGYPFFGSSHLASKSMPPRKRGEEQYLFLKDFNLHKIKLIFMLFFCLDTKEHDDSRFSGIDPYGYLRHVSTRLPKIAWNYLRHCRKITPHLRFVKQIFLHLSRSIISGRLFSNAVLPFRFVYNRVSFSWFFSFGK